MPPAVFKAAAPLTDLRPSTACQFESAFVARRLYNDVIARQKQCVIQNKDALLGRGRDEDVLRLDSGIHAGNNFAQTRRTRRFRVAAPMLKKAVVRTGFKVEQFLDGAGFRVGTRQQVLGFEFVFPEVLLNTKGLDLHGPRVWQGLRSIVQRQIDGLGSVRRTRGG